MTEKVQTDVGFRIFKGNGMLGDVVVTFDSVCYARINIQFFGTYQIRIIIEGEVRSLENDHDFLYFLYREKIVPRTIGRENESIGV